MGLKDEAIQVIDAAVAAGKFPAKRADHYMRAYLAAPEATHALITRMEAVPQAPDADADYRMLYGPSVARAAAERVDTEAADVYAGVYGGEG